ncbi:MAG: glycosyltransferase family 39 protein [Pseudomonadota bacterium]
MAKAKSKRSRAKAKVAPWTLWTLALISALCLLRLGVNALELVPVHFDEAQYWAYGQELAWGYFSKPPLVGAVIRVTTDLFGDTLFALRLASPLAHALIAWLIFLCGRMVYGAPVGFWAALAYSLAPGVGVSAMIVSTDPIMMVFWALALYATLKAERDRAPFWWAVMGIAIGLGTLAKYTMLAFPAGLVLYLLLSAKQTPWRGLAIGLGAALVVMAPNILWNWQNSFATVAHVAEDAAPGGQLFNPDKGAEFLGAQFGVIGPVVFLGLIAALIWREKKPPQGAALLIWQSVTLLLPIILLAFATRAQPNWAAPAYIAGTILAARWLLTRDWRQALIWGQAALGGVLVTVVWGLALLHAQGPDWPRPTDPFKKMRLGEPFCDRALAAMNEEGAEVLLSNDRRRLSECMFLGGLGWDDVATWNPDLTPKNHHELVSTLYQGDERQMLLATMGPGDAIAARFDQAERIDNGQFETHSDRQGSFDLWRVSGFRGY